MTNNVFRNRTSTGEQILGNKRNLKRDEGDSRRRKHRGRTNLTSTQRFPKRRPKHGNQNTKPQFQETLKQRM